MHLRANPFTECAVGGTVLGPGDPDRAGQPRQAAQGHLTNAEVLPGEAVLNRKAPENTSGYSALTFKTPLSAAHVAKWLH